MRKCLKGFYDFTVLSALIRNNAPFYFQIQTTRPPPHAGVMGCGGLVFVCFVVFNPCVLSVFFVCFVVFNPCVLIANRVGFGLFFLGGGVFSSNFFFFFDKLSSLTPHPRPADIPKIVKPTRIEQSSEKHAAARPHIVTAGLWRLLVFFLLIIPPLFFFLHVNMLLLLLFWFLFVISHNTHSVNTNFFFFSIFSDFEV